MPKLNYTNFRDQAGVDTPYAADLRQWKYNNGIFIPASIPGSYELRYALAGLLTYSLWSCLPIPCGTVTKVDFRCRSLQLRDSSGITPDSLFNLAPDGARTKSGANIGGKD
jgi:hypothetical protein